MKNIFKTHKKQKLHTILDIHLLINIDYVEISSQSFYIL
jgi:hypothetical protein